MSYVHKPRGRATSHDRTGRSPRAAAKSKPQATPMPGTHRGLAVLLRDAAALFAGLPEHGTYRFTLGWIGGVWKFELVDDWRLWMDQVLQHEFVAETPQAAVWAFLCYVRQHQIPISQLMAQPDSCGVTCKGTQCQSQLGVHRSC